LSTSSNGKDWNIDGKVNGAYSSSGNEVYASGWVFNGTAFYLYVTTAEGGDSKAAASGTNALSLSELGGVSALSFGWSGVDTFLHDDGNTVILMYEPDGSSGHPGIANDNLYFATAHLSDMTNIENERVVSSSGHERNIIFKDGSEWKWYYSDEADEFNNNIKLRTHPIENVINNPPGLASNPADQKMPVGALCMLLIC